MEAEYIFRYNTKKELAALRKEVEDLKKIVKNLAEDSDIVIEAKGDDIVASDANN
jgi:hypothetical protein